MTEKTEGKKKGVTVKIPKINPWTISTLVLLVVLLVVLVSGWSITGQVVSPDGTGTISANEAGNKAIDYINTYILAGQGTATLESIKEENGLYNAKLNIEGRIYDSYITMDGKLLFPSVIDMTETPETPETTTTQPEEVPKTDEPDVHAFVMSYCPYGLQFMKAYIPVIELLGDKANLELNFVHYIMHGEKEMTENTRMYCIQKEQEDKFTDYLRCFVENGDVEKCISEAGIDEIKLDTCMEDADEEFEITKTFEESEQTYPAYMVDAVLAQQYGVRGSPTFVVNGKTISVTRSPDAIKEAVCSAFNTPPEECEQELSTTAEQPGIGAMGSGSGASSGGQC